LCKNLALNGQNPSKTNQWKIVVDFVVNRRKFCSESIRVEDLASIVVLTDFGNRAYGNFVLVRAKAVNTMLNVFE
jgi:hypothetical protein